MVIAIIMLCLTIAGSAVGLGLRVGTLMERMKNMEDRFETRMKSMEDNFQTRMQNIEADIRSINEHLRRDKGAGQP